MTYRTEFPDFDFEVPAMIAANPDAWEDTSWQNDSCPSFTCDVFVLWIDYTDPAKREFPLAPQFSMHCEGESMLETDSWEDVRAFIEDGKRDFPEYQPPEPLTLETIFPYLNDQDARPYERIAKVASEPLPARQVTEEVYEHFLGVLPPIYVPGGFLVCEAVTGNIYSRYRKIEDLYFHDYAAHGS